MHGARDTDRRYGGVSGRRDGLTCGSGSWRFDSESDGAVAAPLGSVPVPMRELPPKQATLLLCDPSGTVLGTLPPFEVEVPWWQEVQRRRRRRQGAVRRRRHRAAAAACRDRVGDRRGGRPPISPRSHSAPDHELTPWAGADPLADDPLRLPYAQPGGPAADLAWAGRALDELRPAAHRPAEQIRTWNLSSIWRLPTADGAGVAQGRAAVLRARGRAAASACTARVVPRAARRDGPRMLLADDRRRRSLRRDRPELRCGWSRMLVGLQAPGPGGSTSCSGSVCPTGGPRLCRGRAASSLARPATSAPRRSSRWALSSAALPDRFAAIDACGLPTRWSTATSTRATSAGAPDGRVLLDWGDAASATRCSTRRRSWTAIRDGAPRPRLRAHCGPSCGATPSRAATRTGRPAARARSRALRQAMIYQMFLDGIEPDERVYHSGDPAHWLRKAAELA